MIIINYRICLIAAAAAAAGYTTVPARAAPQRNLANRQEMRVSGSDSDV